MMLQSITLSGVKGNRLITFSVQNAGRKFGVFLCTKRKNFLVALILFNATGLIFLKLYAIMQALPKLNAKFSL